MKVRKAIARMGFYEPPSEARTGGELLMLDFNESALPPPPEVMEKLARYLRTEGTNRYPDYPRLEEKLGAYCRVGPEGIIVTNGADQALEVVLRAMLDPGDMMVVPSPCFAMIPHIAHTLGAEVLSPAYREDMSFPLEEIMAAVTPATRLIVLINPNNPTGTAIPRASIEAILDSFPQVGLLVDEAYYEFTGETMAPLIAEHSNLAIVRTFSKAFAMAGLRLGYVISNPAFIRELHKIRGPFDVNALAALGAEAMLERQDKMREYVAEVMTRAKPMVERFMEEHGVEYFRGAANFMLVRPKDAAGAISYMKEHGVLVRPQGGPLADTFRLSIGSMEEMTRFLQVFAAYLERDSTGQPRG